MRRGGGLVRAPVRLHRSCFGDELCGNHYVNVLAYVPEAEAYVVEHVEADRVFLVSEQDFLADPLGPCKVPTLDGKNHRGYFFPIGKELWKRYDDNVVGRDPLTDKYVSLSEQSVRCIIIHHVRINGRFWYVVYEPSNDTYENRYERWWCAFDVRPEVGGGFWE